MATKEERHAAVDRINDKMEFYLRWTISTMIAGFAALGGLMVLLVKQT